MNLIPMNLSWSESIQAVWILSLRELSLDFYGTKVLTY